MSVSRPTRERAIPPGTSTPARPAGSSAVKSNAFSGLNKRFVVASEWYFHPEGIKSLLGPLQKDLAMKNLEAKMVWNGEDATLRLSCLHSDSEEVWEVFFKNLQLLIHQESGEWPDDGSDSGSDLNEIVEAGDDNMKPLKSNKIERLSKFMEDNGATAAIGRTKVEDTIGRNHALDLEYPEKVRSHHYRMIWNHGAVNPVLDEIAPDDVLAKLRDLTGCEFYKDLNISKIFIGADSEEDGHRAIHKLDNIRIAAASNYVNFKHLFYAEDLRNYQISFRYVGRTKKRFFETTLLDNHQLSEAKFVYHNLHLAVTIRCSVFNVAKSMYLPLKEEKFFAAVDLDNKHSDSKQWREFDFNSRIARGNEIYNAMSRFETYSEQRQNSLLSECPEQVGCPSRTAQQPLVASTPIQDVVKVEDALFRFEAEDEPSDDPTVPRASDVDFSNSGAQNPSWVSYIPPSGEEIGKKYGKIRSPSANISINSMIDSRRVHSAGFPVPSLPRLSPSFQQNVCNNSSQDFATGSKGSSYLRHEALPLAIIATKATSINILDEENTMLEVAVLSPIQQPTKWRSESSSDSPAQASAGLSAHRSVVMRSFDESASRKYHTTMNQKAPKPHPKFKHKIASAYGGRLEQPSPLSVRRRVPLAYATSLANDLDPQFIEGMASGFEELLQCLRGFQGELTVQAELGRILMKNIAGRLISSEDIVPSFNPEEALEYLESVDPTPVPVFTKVLTCLPADIPFLVEMRDGENDFIWDQAPQPWDVIYEILCEDFRPGHERRSFIIEIDGERYTSLVKVRREFGAINVHAVKRHWDFRVSAIGAEAKDNTDPAYHELAKVVTDSLHIPKGCTVPQLFFEVPHHLRDLRVFGVRTRRTSRYGSMYGNSMLSISEVRELQVFDIEGDGCTIWKAVGCLDPDTFLQSEGHKFFYLWHEISITCPEADHMFLENKSLELGEQASWDTKKLSEIHAVQSLYLPACEMLKQMDGVGFYNDSEIAPRDPRNVTAPKKEPAPYYFW